MNVVKPGVFTFFSTAPTDMRYSMELCLEEKGFIGKRKEFVFEAMRSVLGERGPQTVEEVSQTFLTDQRIISVVYVKVLYESMNLLRRTRTRQTKTKQGPARTT